MEPSAEIVLLADELPCNHQVLRQVSAVCNQLPVLDKAVFDKDFHSVGGVCFKTACIIAFVFLQQTNEVLLVSYMAAITKGTATASEVSQSKAVSSCSDASSLSPLL